jgi:hypothetical protein
MKEENVHKAVRERYSKIAKTKKERCGCCGGPSSSEEIGDNKSDLDSVPEGADLNFG